MIELDAPDWWDQVPVSSGSSIRIREVEAADAAALLELFSDPRVNQFLYPPPSSLTHFEGFIEWAQRQRQAAKCVCFVVVPNGLQQPIGFFQLRALDSGFNVAEWGFALAPPFWSTGLFEEAASLVAKFAFTIGVKRIEARAVVENGRANRALEKIGAKGRSTAAEGIQAQRPAISLGNRGRRMVRPEGPARHSVRSCAASRANRAGHRSTSRRATNGRTSMGAPAVSVLPDAPAGRASRRQLNALRAQARPEHSCRRIAANHCVQRVGLSTNLRGELFTAFHQIAPSRTGRTAVSTDRGAPNIRNIKLGHLRSPDRTLANLKPIPSTFYFLAF